MEQVEIQENEIIGEVELQQIAKEIRIRNLITPLLWRMRIKRPRIARDTIYRALDNPWEQTDLLEAIRKMAKNMLQENAVQEAA